MISLLLVLLFAVVVLCVAYYLMGLAGFSERVKIGILLVAILLAFVYLLGGNLSI